MDVFYPIRRATTAPRPWFSGRLRLWLGIGLLAMTVLGGALLLQQRLIKVTVSVDGRERTVYTLQRDVTRFLSSHGYEAHAQDIIAVSTAQLQNGARIEIHSARPLLISVDGQQRQVWTQAESVGEALQEGGIKLGWRDQVWMEGKLVQANTVLPPRQWLPPAGNKPHMPWDGELQAVEITLRRASPLVVIDGEGVPATLLTTAATIGEALSEAQVPIYLGDTVFPPLSARVQPGLRVVIRRSLPIAISVEGETYATRTQQSTVGDALAEQGMSLFGLDETEPALSTPLRPYATIRIVRVREEVQYEEEYLPYETIWVPDDNLPIDQRRVNQSGATGIKRLRYRVRFEDGKEVARELEDEWLAVTPETKVIAYGRKITPQTLQTPEGPITYWRKVRMFATSYSADTAGVDPSRPWYGRTRLGLRMTKGIVAVDPTVINLRQEVYVPGYGRGLAGDTGSAIKGKHIDLGYDDHNLRLWSQWVDVYLLWPPPPTYQIRYVLPNWPPER